MANVGYFEAWRMWFSSTDMRDCVLWGMRILWWGRIGKCVELLSALTIVAEIIGEERIALTAEKLHQGIHPLKALKTFFASKTYQKYSWYYMATCSIAINLPWIWNLFHGRSALDNSGWRISLLVIIVIGLFSGLCFIAVFSATILGFLLHIVASGLREKYLRLTIRWFAIITLAVGFHFDLLSS